MGRSRPVAAAVVRRAHIESVRTYARVPADPKTPRERLAARLVEQAFKNYGDLGFPIKSLNEAGGPVVLIETAADLDGLDRVGFNPGDRLEGTTPEDATYDRWARAWVLRYVFTNVAARRW
jgi:hypothetical protein